MSPLFFACLSALSLVLVYAQSETTLKGLTIFKAPYVVKDEVTGEIKGYYVDLLDELALIGKFNYTLTDIKERNDTRDQQRGIANVLVNELYRNKADFAIAPSLYKGHFSKTSRFVGFTETVLESGFSALIAKKRLTENGVSTLDDLFENNRVKPSLEQTGSGIALGTVIGTDTYTDLSMIDDPLGRKVYQWLYYGNNMVESRERGIYLTLNKPFSLIQEMLDNELAIDEHCELTALPFWKVFPNGTKQGIVIEYALATPKNSKHLDVFNKGILELKANGKLDELKRRYWNRYCNDSQTAKIHFLVTSLCTLFSLSLSLFLLR